MKYQGVAIITTNERSTRVQSGWWQTKEQAAEELRYFIVRNLPAFGAFKVVQHIKQNKQ